MPPPSLLSLLPAASVSPRTRRPKQGALAASHRLHSRIPVLLSGRAPSRLRSLSSSSDVVEAGGDGGGGEELHLLDKPFPSPSAPEEDEPEPEAAPAPSTAEALAPFLNFFQVKGADASAVTDDAASGKDASEDGAVLAGRGVIYYDPKPGDLVVGVVVGGDARALDVDVGAGGEPALMLTKEAAPASSEESAYLACDVASGGAREFAAEGRVGVAVGGGDVKVGRTGKKKCAPVVAVGTVVFAEVLGRTLGGRPLLSARRLFRRVAWHRVRQIKQLNVPIKVKISEWNAGGLLSRIEGLRAFLPKPQMITRPRNFTDLKNNVGRQIHVCITKIDERTNELIISEKEAWAMLYLKEGALLEGTVRKLFPYGAQIRIGETNRRMTGLDYERLPCAQAKRACLVPLDGLLHISKITHGQLRSVSDALRVGERVKALVIKSTRPDRIALSIRDLESEPGLFLSNKEKVFAEADEMARRYRETMPATPRSGEDDGDTVPFEDEAESYANWKWLKFIKSDRSDCNPSSTEPSGL